MGRSTAKASDATSSSKAPTAPIGSSAYLLSRIKAREASVMPPLFATSTHLPQARLDALAKFGLLKVNHADEIVSKIFPRSHIGKCLGGGSQSLIAKCVFGSSFFTGHAMTALSIASTKRKHEQPSRLFMTCRHSCIRNETSIAGFHSFPANMDSCL